MNLSTMSLLLASSSTSSMEINELKEDKKALQNKLKENERMIETDRNKDELLSYYKEKMQKYDQMCRLQEVNFSV